MTRRTRSSLKSSPSRSATRWLIAGLVLLLAVLGLTFVAAGAGTVPGDMAIARSIQQPASAEIDAAARAVSIVGDDFPGMVVLAILGIALLVYHGRRDLAVFLAAAAALRALGPLLKVVISSPRPTLEAVVIVAEADGMGFPSGHAMGAALFYGAIAIITPQTVGNRLLCRGIQIAAVTMMVLIALSRVRLGVHWPSDIAGGLLIGLSLVCLMQAAMLVGRDRYHSKSQ